MNSTERLCEQCRKPIVEIFATGRFCNRSCANRFVSNQNLAAKNTKRSLTLKGRKHPLSETTKSRISESMQKRYANDFVVIKGQKTTITKAQLKAYKSVHRSCEICHNPCVTGRNLAVDHDHLDGRFRGLLCAKCNMNYDWYIANQGGIEKYQLKK